MLQPLWTPAPDTTEKTRLYAFMRFAEAQTGQRFQTYQDLHTWSTADIAGFWEALWEFCGIIGDQGNTTLKQQNTVPYARFFTDSTLSFTENMLKHSNENPSDPAIIARCQDGPDRTLTWQVLQEQISLWQQTLEGLGIKENDRITVYLPNIPETIIIFLAASNIGAVFASAGMEMGKADLISRFSQIQPKLMITQSAYTHGEKTIDRTDVIQAAEKEITSLKHILMLDEDGTCTHTNTYTPKPLTFTRRDFNHPLYILFSSGSTGKPKCFEHSSGGVLLKHLCEYQLHCDVKHGDTVFYHATPSWMMWNWLASGLASGAALLMYDGNPFYPNARAQWDFTSAHGCTHHGTAAPIILGWEVADLTLTNKTDKQDLTPLRVILSTGAVLPEQSYRYIHTHIKQDVKISSIAGGTDLVGCFLGGNPATPTYAGQTNGPMLGCDIQIWDDEGAPCQTDHAGELVCATPFPSMPLQFLNDPNRARYEDEYFSTYPEKRVWRHGDSVQKTAQGQYIIIGRSDATLNQNGVRIGASAIYDQLTHFHDSLTDYAAIDFTRPDNKQAITLLFLVLKDGQMLDDDLIKRIKTAIKNQITPYAVPTEIIAVQNILKTPNGKKAEVVMKKILAGQTIKEPDLYGAKTVQAFQEIAKSLQAKYA